MGRRGPGAILVFIAAMLIFFFTRDGLLNQTAPPFSLTGPYGGRTSLSEYRGRPVLLVFWTTS